MELFFFLKEYKMVFSYHQVQERPKLLLALTGLARTEFHQLLSHFQYAWDQYVQQHYVDRDDRQRQYGAGRSEATLVTLEDKLLFILYYVKVSPLQEILAFEFGMVQSTANEWIHILSEVLKTALDHGGYVPERDPKQLGTVLASEAESTYGIDGTERPRQRPRDPEKQKHYYSGKKKHTRSRISFLAASIRAKSII
jgi:Helix-turn-helix of DDE superfamily endonuclease